MPPRWKSLLTRRPAWSAETAALVASLTFTLLGNGAFWRALTDFHPLRSAADGLLFFSAALLMTGLQWFLLLLVAARRTLKPLLMLLAVTTAAAVYFVATYKVYLSPAMLRNVLETDIREAGELLQPAMLLYVLYAAIAIALITRLRPPGRTWRRALLARGVGLAAALLMTGSGFWLAAADLAPLFRQHKELRFLVTPSNAIFSALSALKGEAATSGATATRQGIALDARRPELARRPRAVVLAVGETVRAANWGLSGYARQTTPELAARRVINFAEVSSCGTDTATSVPCMFSLAGRRHYDEAAIRRQESLLHVLHRTGVDIFWRDNQSGCKGVCVDLPHENLSRAKVPGLCEGGRCFDAILLDNLPEIIDAAPGDILIVLHLLGSHGPAYFQRYPAAFRQWTPTCDTTNLAACTREALVNTYDNSVLYTDHVLAAAIDQLRGVTSHDTALLYVSDHGESLGEKGLYLHGMPWAIAPAEQTQVPLILWFAPGQSFNTTCLAQRAKQPASHDNLFHTLLGLFDVETAAYEPQMDLLAGCVSED
ncbi:MAG: phosphoethanolamine--lipid A transferase [Azonexus sp.]|jgi:lipid A ethanolaminephosphotransferase|nr:phosphoethanolamine--lipid A transferase [Azonexus sp.]